jgi:hypothetical protein
MLKPRAIHQRALPPIAAKLHPLSRRDCLKVLAVASSSALLTGNVSAAPPGIEVLDTKVISPPGAGYCGWPTLARQKSGRLMVAWSGGRESHVCPFGRVEWMTSHDNGTTWTWPRTLLDSDLDDRDAGLVETSQGTLLATTFTSLAYEPVLAKAEKSGAWPAEQLTRWQAARDRLDADQRKQQLASWILRSTDNGLSWSPPARVPVNSPHGPVALSDGRLLYAGKSLWSDDGRIGVAVSNDDGANWNWLAQIPTREGDTHREYHELHAVECPSGRIVAQIRNENAANHNETLQSESEDGGLTWTTPHTIGVWGTPSHLLRLRDGRLMMSYGHRRAPIGNQARLSSDEGRTWSEPVLISSDAPSGDMGYPSTVKLDDGRFVTVWYELPAGQSHAVLRQARWRLT